MGMGIYLLNIHFGKNIIGQHKIILLEFLGKKYVYSLYVSKIVERNK
jgi:hypothetical protein